MQFFLDSKIAVPSKSTRGSRDNGASRKYTLHSTTHLTAQKIVLTVTTNKSKLIYLICDDRLIHKEDFKQNKLVVSGSPVPLEIYCGVVIHRQGMSTSHGEAHTIIVQQVANVPYQKVADDTSIFVLLLHFCEEPPQMLIQLKQVQNLRSLVS
jgi:hypothetical protein